MASQSSEIKSSEINGDLLDNRFLRLLLFVVTFISVPFLFWWPTSFSEYSLMLLFPMGLITFFARNATVVTNWSIIGVTIVGWIIYVGVLLSAVLVKKRSLFVFLYIIFLLLLFVNVAGCNLISIGF